MGFGTDERGAGRLRVLLGDEIGCEGPERRGTSSVDVGAGRGVDLEGRGAAHAVGVFRVENENGEYGRELT